MTAGVQSLGALLADDDLEEIEIERHQLVPIVVGALQNEVDFLFHNRITALRETADAINPVE